VLCREAWRIDPSFEPVPPGSAAAVENCDAALLIGDPALFLDHRAAGLAKIDLGAEWTQLTGLPFVWAFWAGRPGVLDAAGVAALQEARDEGIRDSDAIADAYCGVERAGVCRRYLRDNIKYRLGARELEGLRRYYELAANHGLVERAGPVEFY
jgi:chorismate dehydratase